MNKLFLILSFTICLIVYLNSYFSVSNEHGIIHTTLRGITDSTFHSKLPVYIYDKLVNPADLLYTLFKYQYIYHVLSFSNSSLLKKNLSKYLVIYNDSDTEDSVVSLLHPNLGLDLKYYKKFCNKNFKISKSNLQAKQKDAFVHVKIKPKNCIVLPHAWIYNTNVDNILEIHLFDLFTGVKSIF